MIDIDPYIGLSAELVSAWRRGVRQVRIAMTSAFVCVILGIIVAAIGELPQVDKTVTTQIAASLGVLGGLLVLGVLGYQKAIRLAEQATRVERAERLVEENPREPKAAWELAQVKLETYLNRNLKQVRSIFWLTVIVLTLGFVLIGYGVFRAYLDPAVLTGPILSAASGVLVNFIAATFLVIYRSTMAQAKDYVTVLERINAVGMAVKILDTLDDADGNLRRQTTAEIAKELLKMYGSQKSSTEVAR